MSSSLQQSLVSGSEPIPIKEIHVLWITAGLGYDGDTIAMTAATQPSIEDILDDRKKLEQAMYEEVLDIEHFPVAVYESSQVTVQKLSDDLLRASVSGELSFHGITRTNSFDARVTAMGTMLRISGDFSLRQSDYGIKPVLFAAGALRLKDEVKFSFELVARMQEEPGASV